eukprot:m.92667 g.92667  ORF g.92667 m.92667 type:complete len:203 (+) comp36755_c0_seq3:766-1374(+)
MSYCAIYMLQASDVSVVPIVYALGSRKFSYIRVHRRAGKKRQLNIENIKKWALSLVHLDSLSFHNSWADRLTSAQIQSTLEGPTFFMWGTDHEDQPIINSQNLTSELGRYSYDWKGVALKSGAITKFCIPQPKGSPASMEETPSLMKTVESKTDEEPLPKTPKLTSFAKRKKPTPETAKKPKSQMRPKPKKTLKDFFTKLNQ